MLSTFANDALETNAAALPLHLLSTQKLKTQKRFAHGHTLLSPTPNQAFRPCCARVDHLLQDIVSL